MVLLLPLVPEGQTVPHDLIWALSGTTFQMGICAVLQDGGWEGMA